MHNREAHHFTTGELYNPDRSLFFIEYLNRELANHPATSELVIALTSPDTGQNALVGAKASQIIDSFLGFLMVAEESTDQPPDNNGWEDEESTGSVERIRAFLKIKTVRRSSTQLAHGDNVPPSQDGRDFATNAVRSLAREIATSELEVFKNLRNRHPTSEKGAVDAAEFNEMAKSTYHDNVGGFIIALYRNQVIDEKACLGMLFVTGAEPEPKSVSLRSSAGAHKLYAAKIVQGRITALQKTISPSPDLVIYTKQLNAGLQHIMNMFALPDQKHPYLTLAKLASETFYFDPDAHGDKPVVPEQTQRRYHLQRIVRETNYALDLLFRSTH